MNKFYVYKGGKFRMVDIDMYDSTLDAMQDAVDGYIERIPVPVLDAMNVDIWCNDEMNPNEEPTAIITCNGKLEQYVFGPILFTMSNEDGDTLPICDEMMEKIIPMFTTYEVTDERNDNKYICIGLEMMPE